MPDQRPKVLFLNHSATRNGASILLLALLRWLKQNANLNAEVLLMSGGPMLDEFRDLARTRVWKSPGFLAQMLPRRWSRRVRPALERALLRAWMTGRRYDLVYANTAATASTLAAFQSRTQAVLLHVHELGYALRTILSPASLSSLSPRINRYIVVSELVGATLREEFGVEGDKIDVVNGFVDATPPTADERIRSREAVLRDFGWPANAFVVGGCGALGWRKGTDLFLRIAQTVCRQPGSESARFLWLGGGDENEKESLRFDHDLKLLGLRACCSRVQSTGDVQRYYRAMDVFALTSREDPFPLVMLEAGALGVPLVCFEGSGGGPEFAGQDAGRIVPYLDATAFAAQLMALHADPGLRRRLGGQAACRVREHHAVERQAPRIQRIIERYTASGHMSASGGVVLSDTRGA